MDRRSILKAIGAVALAPLGLLKAKGEKGCDFYRGQVDAATAEGAITLRDFKSLSGLTYMTPELLEDSAISGDMLKTIERYQMMACEQLEAKAMGLPDPYPALTAWNEELAKRQAEDPDYWDCDYDPDY